MTDIWSVGSGVWGLEGSTDSDWSDDTPPTPGESVQIGSASSSPTVTIDGGVLGYIGGSTVNYGTIAIDALATYGHSAVYPSGLAVSGTTTLTGGGAITLSASGDYGSNFLSGTGAGAVLDNVNNTISGNGIIGNSGDFLTTNLNLINEAGGTVDATGTTVALTVNGASAGMTVTNYGLMELNDTEFYGLAFENAQINQSGSGTLDAAGGNVTLSASTVSGGTLESSGNNAILTNTSGTLDGTSAAVTITAGSTVEAYNGGILTLAATSTAGGSIINHGTIAVVTLAYSTELEIGSGANGTVTLSGGGKVTLQDTPSTTYVRGFATTDKLVNQDNTISGAGELGYGQMSLDNQAAGTIDGTGQNVFTISMGSGSFSNEGLIEATGSGGVAIDSALTNSGTVESQASSNLVIDSGTLTNTATIEALANSTLTVELTTVTNTGGTIEAVGANALLDLDGVSISGGTVAATTGGTVQILFPDGASTIDGATIDIDATSTFEMANGSQLHLGSTVDNAGTFSVGSTNAYAQLIVDSNGATFQDGGAFKLTDSSQNLVYGPGKLTNVDNTIQGAGDIGYSGELTLDNQSKGTIDGTGTHNALIINAPTFTNEGLTEAAGSAGLAIENSTVTNTGTIEALAGSTLTIQSSTVTNTGGTIEAVGAGAILDLGGSTVDGGALAASTGGAIQIVAGYGSSPVDGATVSIDATSTLALKDGAELELGSTVDNAGTLSMGGNFAFTQLVIDSNGAKLQDGGIVSLTDSGNNLVYGPGKLTNVDNTIKGSGDIGYSGELTFDNQVGGTVDATGTNHALIINAPTFSNEGLTEATGGAGLAIENSTATNTGTIEALAGATLTLQSSTVTNTGATIEATGTGATLNLEGTTIDGGAVTAATGATIQVLAGYGTSKIDGATVSIDATSTLKIGNGGALTLGSTVDNAGAISLGASVSFTQITVDSNGATLQDGGTVTLTDSAYNLIYGPGTLTNVDNTIKGAGDIGYTGELTLDNQAKGTIDATGTFNALVINAPTFTNEGLAEATGNAGLAIENSTATNTGTIEALSSSILTIQSSTVTNTGGTVEAVGGILDLGGATLNGGTVAATTGATIEVVSGYGESKIDAATFTIDATSTLQINDGGALDLAGTVGNAGTLALNGNGRYTQLIVDTGGVTLEDGGTVTLTDSPYNVIYGPGTLTNADNTIQGSGDIGYSGELTLDNQSHGTIDATGNSNALTVNAPTFTNEGLAEATGGAGLTIQDSTVTNSGTIEALAGSIVNFIDDNLTNNNTIAAQGGIIGIDDAITNNGTLNADGGTLLADDDVTGTGSVTISDGGYADFFGAFNQSVSFSGTGTLLLGDSQSSTPASISGFTAGDFIELADLGYSQDATLQWTENGSNTGGTLLVTDGSTTESLSFTGVYTQSRFEIENEFGSLEIVAPISWASDAGGNWTTAADWSPAVVPGSDNDVEIAAAGSKAYTVTSAADVTVNTVWTAPKATLDITGGTFTVVSGTDSGINSATVKVENGAVLELGATFANGPTGLISVLGGGLLNLVGGSISGGIVSIALNGEVAATGNISGSIIAGTTVTDKGELLADDGTTLTLDTTVNATITSSNGAIVGGIVEASDDGSVSAIVLDGGAINRGELVAGANGTIETASGSGSTLNGVTIAANTTVDVVDGSILVLGGAITDLGTIALDAQSDPAELLITGASLSGGGFVDLGDNPLNLIDAISIATLTNTADVVEGAGSIGQGEGNLVLVNKAIIEATGTNPLVIDTGNSVTNTGTLEATGASELVLYDAVTDTGAGLIASEGATSDVQIDNLVTGATGGAQVEAAVAGALVELDGGSITGGKLAIVAGATAEADGGPGAGSAITGVNVTNAGTLLAIDTTTLTLGAGTKVNNAGGVIEASDASASSGSTIVLAGATVIGGTLETNDGGVIETAAGTTSTLVSVTISGGPPATTVDVVDGSTLALKGAITNDGTLALSSGGDATGLQLIANTTLTGGGAVTLTDQPANANTITANLGTGTGPFVLTNTNNTISGAGEIGTGDGSLELSNKSAGTIDADGSNALTIDTGNTVTNAGLLEATGPGGLTVTDAVLNTGTISADGANVTIGGNLSGAGQAEISSGSEIELQGALNKGAVSFENNAGNTGVLVLDDAGGFKGTVAGMYNDGLGSDALDLQNINFASGVTWSFKENANGQQGVLTVKDKMGDAAAIMLLGQYLAAGGTASSTGAHPSTIFQTAADPTTGTTVTTSIHAPAAV